MEKSILHQFGSVVRNERNKAKISQEELGNLCGLHRTYISDIELGKRNVSLENIELIAKALNVPIHDLFLMVENESV